MGLNGSLKKLELFTGLSINKQKSKAFFSKGCKFKEEISSILGVSIGNFPIKYLGLPLSRVYPKTRMFSPLIDKVRDRTEGWQLGTLSFAGRAELTRCVLHNLIGYWVYAFKLPGTVIKESERLLSNFIWNNKMHCWNRKEICRPKSEGGVGTRRLVDLNQASGVRLVWRLCSSKSLWSNWMSGHYLQGAHISQVTVHSLDSGRGNGYAV